MSNETIQQNETFRLGVSVKDKDGGPNSADLVVFNDSNIVVIQKSDDFVPSSDNSNQIDGDIKYEADLSTSDTNVSPGDYKYFVRINWLDGTNDIVPDSGCVEKGECEYPILTICEKPNSGVS